MNKPLTITDSINAIQQAREPVGEIFYAMLFSGYPEIRQHFVDVNMAEQAALVTMAFVIIEQNYTEPNSVTRQYLRVLGSRHRRKQIPKNLYSDWQQALLDTLRSFHKEDWSPSLAVQWREAIDDATRIMFEGYKKYEKEDAFHQHEG